MPKAFRHVLPALFVLAPLFTGGQVLAAQQPLAQTSEAAAAAEVPDSGAARRPAGAADVERAGTERPDAGGGEAKAPSRELKLPSRDLAAASGRDSQPAEGERVFGRRAFEFTTEAAGAARQGSGQPGRQQQKTQGGADDKDDPDQTANPPQPLTSGQKMKRAFRNAFLSPTPYAFTAFSATLTQAGEDELPDKDFEDEFGDWASRFARTFATRTSRNILTNGVYASLFKQDPRYHRPRNKSFGKRVLYAVGRVVVIHDDDGNLEPNYSRFAGTLTANAIANVYERSTPGHDRIGADSTFRRFAFSFVTDAFTNVLLREIVPTVLGR